MNSKVDIASYCVCMFLDVIKEMGEVTDHINEMQRLCETYWPLINHLSNDAQLHEVLNAYS